MIEEAARSTAGGLAPVDGPGAPASADRRQRDARVLPSTCGHREHRKPGAGFVYLNLDFAQRGIDAEYLIAPHLAAERSVVDQPDGSRRMARRPRAIEGADVLEHQHRGVQPAAGAPAEGADARGPVHRRAGPLPHGHHRLRRLRATGGELPRIRRSRGELLPPDALGTGQGGRADGRGATESGNLSPSRACDGLHRA